MNLLITGSRNVDQDTALAAIAAGIVLLSGHGRPQLILHGGASGTDTAAELWAQNQGVPVICILPDYARHGSKAAPLRRNTLLVAKASAVLAVYAPDHWRKGGTWDTAKKAAAAGLPLLEMETGTLRHHYTPPPVTLF
jgi:hypothetical protein